MIYNTNKKPAAFITILTFAMMLISRPAISQTMPTDHYNTDNKQIAEIAVDDTPTTEKEHDLAVPSGSLSEESALSPVGSNSEEDEALDGVDTGAKTTGARADAEAPLHKQDPPIVHQSRHYIVKSDYPYLRFTEVPLTNEELEGDTSNLPGANTIVLGNNGKWSRLVISAADATATIKSVTTGAYASDVYGTGGAPGIQFIVEVDYHKPDFSLLDLPVPAGVYPENSDSEGSGGLVGVTPADLGSSSVGEYFTFSHHVRYDGERGTTGFQFLGNPPFKPEIVKDNFGNIEVIWSGVFATEGTYKFGIRVEDESGNVSDYWYEITVGPQTSK